MNAVPFASSPVLETGITFERSKDKNSYPLILIYLEKKSFSDRNEIISDILNLYILFFKNIWSEK